MVNCKTQCDSVNPFQSIKMPNIISFKSAKYRRKFGSQWTLLIYGEIVGRAGFNLSFNQYGIQEKPTRLPS